MHKLMEYICGELEELERKADKEGKLSMAEIEYVDKLAHIKKSLLTSEEMWEDSEYSEAGRSGNSYRGGNSNRGRQGGSSYEGGGSSYEGSSYARGRGRNARRDSMGRYSRGYSMEDGLAEKLQEMMEDASNERERESIRKVMNMI